MKYCSRCVGTLSFPPNRGDIWQISQAGLGEVRLSQQKYPQRPPQWLGRHGDIILSLTAAHTGDRHTQGPKFSKTSQLWELLAPKNLQSPNLRTLTLSNKLSYRVLKLSKWAMEYRSHQQQGGLSCPSRVSGVSLYNKTESLTMSSRDESELTK